jgi:hypothetical protein
LQIAEKMSTAIDHLVIAAETLEQGADYIQHMLGVDIPIGGVHPKMGTHNRLMQLGDALFLEVIAINPNAPAPEQPRWFGLDDAYVRRSLEDGPALLTWVVNTDNIKSLMQKTRFNFGRPELISRGNLSWYFGLPDDGRLLAGGMLPYLIEWQTAPHPARNMKDKGCKLERLTLYHPYATWLKQLLESIDIAHQISIESLPENVTPYMLALIETPGGIKELRSRIC